MIQLLQRNSLTVANTFLAEKFALNLCERQSTATVTIGPEAPTISVGDWLRDTEDPGAGIVWRVKSVDTDYGGNTRTLQCEHMINSLKDMIMFGEVTPEKISGVKKAEECTAIQAVRYILKQQSIWALGDFAYSKSNPYSFNGDDLYSALETVSSSLMDEWWSYDFSVYPFKLSIKKKETEATCEMRTDRNIQSLKKTVDRSRMYTRFYPIGKDNLMLDEKYIGKNEGTYGVICKVETDNSKGTKKKLKNWANERLNHHAEPTVTVTISGMDLAYATGEPLDRLTLGKVCRVPLPEFSTTITERISKLSWGDKIADRESVTITLANEYVDLATIVNNLQKDSSKGGRSSAKNSEEDHAWITDTTEKVEIVAEAVGGKGPDGKPNWSRVSSLTVDGNGIDARVTKTEGDMVKAQSQIKQTETSITQVVTAVGSNGKVTAASIMTSINNDHSEIRISADKVFLEGNISLNSVLKVLSNTATFTGLVQFGTDTATRIRIGSGYVSTPNIRIGSGTQTHQVNFAVLDKMVKTMESRSGGTIRLTRFDGTYLDFSRAISSWTWGGGNSKINVTALPQNQTKSVKVSIDGRNTISTNGSYTYTVDYENSDGDDVSTEATKTVTVNVSPSKSDIGASRGSRRTTEPTADASLSGITANGWYIITVTVSGTSKTYKIEVDV